MLRAMGMTRVAAVMAAYNRRELTLACLRSLEAQQVPGVELDVFVLDDASSDGTSQAIAEQFPQVNVLRGDGHLYWNGGMRRAFGAAIERDYDHYLWMNDDASLDAGAVALLLDGERQLRDRGEEAAIVARSTRHPATGELTSGGVVHPFRWRPFLEELRELWSIKTLSPRPWAVYARRWAGWLWPLYWASPYLRRGCRLAREHLFARRVAADSS
jgi:glycosyltransferase involved in cell wall biosynthesis